MLSPMNKVMLVRAAGAAVLLVATLAALGGCSAGRHYEVDADVFVHTAETAQGSLNAQQFVGTAYDRAFLYVWHPTWIWLGQSKDVYSVRIDELPAPLAARIRNGENPWADR
ncbi:MAG: hypothetical protein R3F29_08970 [Planctomycetota bacterium]